jgi:hypothetical protein
VNTEADVVGGIAFALVLVSVGCDSKSGVSLGETLHATTGLTARYPNCAMRI